MSGINIDRTAPKVAISGVKAGKTYRGKAPKVALQGDRQALSGVASCTVTHDPQGQPGHGDRDGQTGQGRRT